MKLKNLKVLVVDDYEKMRHRIYAILQQLGLVISEASNGDVPSYMGRSFLR
jgi:CheY-like chemotaxis protein